MSKAVERSDSVLRVRCVTGKYGNFVYNKIYTAEAHSRHIGGDKLYSDYKVVDEDGDYFILKEKDLGRMFLIIPEKQED